MQIRPCALIVLALLSSAAIVADDAKKSDENKLPVGTVLKGTVKFTEGDKISAFDLVITITKREGTAFEAEWSQNNGKGQFVVEGTIAANNKVTMSPVKKISGPNDDVVGNTKVTGALKADNSMTGTGFVKNTKRTFTWTVKLAKE